MATRLRHRGKTIGKASENSAWSRLPHARDRAFGGLNERRKTGRMFSAEDGAVQQMRPHRRARRGSGGVRDARFDGERDAKGGKAGRNGRNGVVSLLAGRVGSLVHHMARRSPAAYPGVAARRRGRRCRVRRDGADIDGSGARVLRTTSRLGLGNRRRPDRQAARGHAARKCRRQSREDQDQSRQQPPGTRRKAAMRRRTALANRFVHRKTILHRTCPAVKRPKRSRGSQSVNEL